ncbi:MAG: CinA family nicotinamide mononucleotide deamidase-related protein [Geminicoccaceae bacterium]
MRCEILAIGTELLLGQIVDTNSSWIGGQLALAGIDSHYQTKVGDNQARMVECLKLALSRSDAVICCGGLGPTQDDITREAIAEVMGTRLVRRDAIAEHIRDMFEKRGREMAPSNLRQADVPEGVEPIKEMPGTAPGLVCPIGNKVIYAVPGVPHEMRTMLEGAILPDLKRRAGVTSVIKSRVLRTWGFSESGLADHLAGRIADLDNSGKATLAFQASGIEGIKVRITAKGPDADSVDSVLKEEEVCLRTLIGDYVFGVDDQTMESVVLDLLREGGQSLAVAEGITSGLLGSRLAAIAGSSDVFRGSILTDQPKVRENLFGLPADAPYVTEEAAKAMAEGVRKHLAADIGLAATGHDGQEGPAPNTNGIQPGTVYLAMATADGVYPAQVMLPGDRRRITQYSVISLLNLLRRRLLGITSPAVL